ncbi:serine hydrolase domain-containing protein [Mesorhizobium sp.]|uniref:serine hydrolase n=1 Tax=Mesorhizobium sp. TaxID=1871066 RepID=UPI0025DF1C1B|nr:serine hydrolase domain-containing protein [Mesorhizobium sp.]
MPATSADIVSLYRDIDDTNAPAGTTWSYTNGGYLLLTAAIEQIAGKPFKDVLRERIFDPAGMFNTMLRRRDRISLQQRHYAYDGGRWLFKILSREYGGRGRHHLNDRRHAALAQAHRCADGRHGRNLEAHEDAACSRQRNVDGVWPRPMDRQISRRRQVRHAGGGHGANSQMIKLPGAGLDIVVMVNRHDASAVTFANQIIDACVPGLQPVKEEVQTKLLSGVYVSSKTQRVVQLSAAERATSEIKEGQQIATIDGMDIPLTINDDGTLRPGALVSPSRMSVAPEGGGAEPASLKLSEFGNVDQFARQKPLAQTNAEGLRAATPTPLPAQRRWFMIRRTVHG